VELSRGAYTGTGANSQSACFRGSIQSKRTDFGCPLANSNRVRIGRKAGWSPAALVCVVFLERSAAHWFVVNWWLDEIHLKKEVPM